MGDLYLDELDPDMFIRTVQRHPVIWDPANGGYHDRSRKRMAWMDIGAAICEYFEERENFEKRDICKTLSKKWRNIKDNYIKSLKKRPSKSHHPYIYTRQLEFLKPVLYISSGLRMVRSPDCAERIVKSDFEDDIDSDPLTDLIQAAAAQMSSPPRYTRTTRWSSDTPQKNSKRLRLEPNRVIDTKPASKNPFESDEDDEADPMDAVETNSKRLRLESNQVTDATRQSSTNPFEIDYLDEADPALAETTSDASSLLNPDRSFFESVLPSVADFDEDEKLAFRSDVLSLIIKTRKSRKYLPKH